MKPPSSDPRADPSTRGVTGAAGERAAPDGDSPTSSARVGSEDDLETCEPTGARWRGPYVDEACIFSSGDLVAERYRVVRLIASGGNGEVYEAEDLALEENVALKTIRPELASSRRAVELFKREIQLARKVTHPNVCRIFELGTHRRRVSAGDASGASVLFLTMELLAGETLRERLRLGGRMTTGQALPIVSDMASALGAAHKAGIVHRDFKSANVILVPLSGEPGGIRAVVTDFGLARGAAGDEDHGRSASNSAILAGTPAYMAPEQVEGRRLTSAADVYALGVVIYEMVTGRLPFEGDTPMSVAIKRLHQPPSPPVQHVASLDPRWEAVILRCLRVDPAERFASATDVAEALGGSAATTRIAGAGSGKRQRPRPGIRGTRLALAAVAVAILGAVAAGGQLLLTLRARHAAPTPYHEGAGPLPVPVRTRPSVAVVGFRNLSGKQDAAWLSVAFSEMLATELASGGKLRIVPGETVSRSRLELSLPDVDSFRARTLTRLGANLGSDFVVVGSYMSLGEGAGGALRLDFRIQDTRSGETIHAEAVIGTVAGLFDLVASAGARIRGRLGMEEAWTGASEAARVSFPSNPEAARLYAEGLMSLRSSNPLAARDALESAVAIEPNAPLVYSALAQAWSELGYEGKAQTAAEQAFERSGALPEEDRLLIEGRYAEITYRWGRAAEIYGTLLERFPDNLDHGLALARVQASSETPMDALGTLERLRGLAPKDPRIDLGEAEAAFALLDYERSLRAAEAAAHKGRSRGGLFLVCRARETEAAVYLRQGNPAKAIEAAEEMKGLASGMGDRGQVLETLHLLGSTFEQQGEVSRATKAFEDGLEIARSIGNEHGAIDMSIHLAEAAAQRGDLGGAEARMREAMAAIEKLDDVGFLPWALTRSARVEERRGDLAAAEARYRRAVEIAAETDERAEALFHMGGLLVKVDKLDEARRNYETVLEIRRELGEKGSIARCELALAALSLEEGRSAEAEGWLRGAIEQFSREGSREAEARARSSLARALAGRSRLDEARGEAERAEALAAASEDLGSRLAVAIATGRIRAASDPEGARRTLTSAIAEASNIGLVGEELEARLALGEIELGAGRAEEGRALLAKVAEEARAKGYLNVARRAEGATP